jgi:hypothetical protein
LAIASPYQAASPYADEHGADRPEIVNWTWPYRVLQRGRFEGFGAFPPIGALVAHGADRAGFIETATTG